MIIRVKIYRVPGRDPRQGAETYFRKKIGGWVNWLECVNWLPGKFCPVPYHFASGVITFCGSTVCRCFCPTGCVCVCDSVSNCLNWNNTCASDGNITAGARRRSRIISETHSLLVFLRMNWKGESYILRVFFRKRPPLGPPLRRSKINKYIYLYSRKIFKYNFIFYFSGFQ